MAIVKGEVTAVYENDNGTFNVAMDDGEKYSFYKNKPEFSRGDVVSFEYKMNGKWRNADAKSVSIETSAPAASGDSGNAPAQHNDTQSVIQWQSARKAALTFLDIAMREGTVKLPAAQDKKFDALSYLLLEITQQFHKEARVQGPAEDSSKGAGDDDDE